MRIFLIFFSVVLLLGSCSVPENAIVELPRIKPGELVVNHYAYRLRFNPDTRQADWVAYALEQKELEQKVKRTDKFTYDPFLGSNTASNNDYKGSGFDRGHLVPAADMSWNQQAMKESFYFSNISPQLPGFNRGIWKKLEVHVREKCLENGNIYIVTGPVFSDVEEVMGESKIPVPSHFFKTLLIYNDSVHQGIGYIFRNEKMTGDLVDFAVTIDSVESFTGFDLYPILPNKTEKTVESRIDVDYWYPPQ